MAFESLHLPLLEKLARNLEKSKTLLFLLFTLLYSYATYKLSAQKLLWNDELFTYYIATLPSMTDVVSALKSGGEQLPPFFYLITRASLSLFGVNNLALRLPEIIGFWVMCLCLYIFVSRRASNFYGLLAAFFPLVIYSYYYAFEARPYGLLLGFSGLALLSWQSAAMNRLRLLSIIGLTMSLAAAVSVHYYGLFVIFPIALGELARTVARRRIDVAIWAAFALAFIPLILQIPIIRQTRANAGIFWAPTLWMNVPDFYFNALYLAVLPFVCLIFLAGIYQSIMRSNMPDEERQTSSELNPQIYEIAAAVGFVIFPIFSVALAKYVIGAFGDRYVVYSIIGFSILISFVAAKLYNNSSLMPALLLICCAAWFGVLIFKGYWLHTESKIDYVAGKIQLLERNGEADLPIVAADSHTFIELEHYAPPEIKSRVVYLADPEISLQRLQHNSLELGMVNTLKPWFKLKVVDYKPFIGLHDRFLLCGGGGFSWIFSELEEKGMKFEYKGSKSGSTLFLVTPGEKETTARVH